MLNMTDSQCKSLYAALTQQARISISQLPAESAPQAWLYLEAAHIVGQRRFTLHADSHWNMLVFAFNQHDYREVAGQLFRLLLVPLGHLIGKLPMGNTGRSRVSAFAPMAISKHHQDLIERFTK